MFENTDIIITSNITKKELLKSFNSSLNNIKIYTISEFNKLYYGNYSKEAILYIMNKYNVIYEIANIYLNNLTYIEDKEYKRPKLKFLKELKQDLINNKLYKINNLFKESLKEKKIIIYNLYPTKELELLKQSLDSFSHVEIINNKEKKYLKHDIYLLPTIEDEVVYVANSICKNIKDGVDIKNIYLVNLNDEYYKLIRRIFPMFNIPYTINDKQSIYGTFIVNKFLELYSNDMNKTLEELKEYISSDESEAIYNQILSIVNNYAFINNYEDVKSLIKTDLKNTKIKNTNIINSVHESDLENIYTEDDYVYLLSFNQGIIPVIHKDENYLSDKDKEELNISLTVDKNIQEKEDTIKYLSNIKNIIITSKKIANGEEFNISNINEELNYPIIKEIEQEYNYSNLYNKIKLTSLKDEYNKYGTTSETLLKLASTYNELPYNTYDHSFKGINIKDLHKFLNDKLSLSYTKVDNYFKCPFSYYINYILKLNIYEDTFYQRIGTLFHAVLEKFNKFNGTYDELWNQELNNLKTEFTNQELFFLEKLHDELLFIIDTIKEQENYTELHDELHEEKIYTSLSGNIKITFSGIIDKVKYKKEANRTIIAIIDYKTGSVDVDLKTVPYGIGMQLPVYLYLAHNTNKLENIEVAGFYLQHILNNEVVVEKNKSYEEEKKKGLLLQGYSNTNFDIISTFDNSFAKSNMIKSLSLTKDDKFYSYSKVLSSKQMNHLKDIAEENINKAAEDISNAKFEIAPKKIGDTNYGCKYCKYKDICFHSNEDIVELEELSKEDVIGGEE